MCVCGRAIELIELIELIESIELIELIELIEFMRGGGSLLVRGVVAPCLVLVAASSFIWR